jgi:uncharacterized protein with PQ loop repeat
MNFFNHDTLGWLSAICFGISPLPQVIKCFKEKHALGISWGFITLWLAGEIFAISYILPRKDVPLLTNYMLNTVYISIILYYKIKGASNERRS